jgi:hypothetical protein
MLKGKKKYLSLLVKLADKRKSAPAGFRLLGLGCSQVEGAT